MTSTEPRTDDAAPLLEAPIVRQPLSLHVRESAAPPAFENARCLRLEYTSRGDRVPARVILPARPGPAPLVLLQHGAGGSKDAEYLDVAAPWVKQGAAVASIDLPLHGERSSPKLSEILLSGLSPAAAAAGAETLVREFARQSIADLGGCLDAAAELKEIDSSRTVFAAFSLGAMIGAAFCALDSRPRAVALALCGGGLGPAALDPASYVARIAPRPLLMVNASQDERVPRSAAEALFDAAGEPKRIEWFEAGHGDLPGVAMKAMWQFIQPHLG